MGTGTLCGSISYVKDTGLWELSGTYSFYGGVSTPGGEGHGEYARTGVTTLVPDWGWLPWNWG